MYYYTMYNIKSKVNYEKIIFQYKHIATATEEILINKYKTFTTK
jgi:hypothetical protein